ncbi:MAG: hypothetical protein AAF744_06800 [Pseudomonadota bacterium]
MDFPLIGLLSFSTFVLVIGFALYSKRKVEKRMDDPNSTKSTLAADKSSTGTPADV